MKPEVQAQLIKLGYVMGALIILGLIAYVLAGIYPELIMGIMFLVGMPLVVFVLKPPAILKRHRPIMIGMLLVALTVMFRATEASKAQDAVLQAKQLQEQSMIKAINPTAYLDDLKSRGSDEEWLNALKELRPEEYAAEMARREDLDRKEQERQATAQREEFVDVYDLEIGSKHISSKEVPLMPTHSTQDPMKALADVKYAPVGSVIKILEAKTVDAALWYRVEAFSSGDVLLGTGWINPIVLTGAKSQNASKPSSDGGSRMGKGAFICQTEAGLDEAVRARVNNDMGQFKALFDAKACVLSSGVRYSMVEQGTMRSKIKVYYEELTGNAWALNEMLQ